MPTQRFPRQTGLYSIKSVRYRRFPVVDVSTGGSTTFNQFVMFFEKQGPASYATGGFVIDLSDTYSSLNDVKLLVKKGSRGSLPGGRLEYDLNTPSAGQVTVKVQKYRYSEVTAVGNVDNEPAGVTVQAASGVAASSEAAHIHVLTHNHGPATSTASAASGAAVHSDLLTLNLNISTHTHSVDIPNLVGNTDVGSSHNHVDNNIYQHQHTEVLTDINLTVTELPNATSLATTIWLGLASGVRA